MPFKRTNNLTIDERRMATKGLSIIAIAASTFGMRHIVLPFDILWTLCIILMGLGFMLWDAQNGSVKSYE